MIEISIFSYFWRIYTGAEVDYIEEKNGVLYAYEIKYKKVRKTPPSSWTENYGSNFSTVIIDNFQEFIL